MAENVHYWLKLPGASSASLLALPSRRDFSEVSRTITDARLRLSPKTVEAMELIRWAVCGSLLNIDV